MAEGRVAEAVAAARELLEAGGPGAVSMRAIADRMGIRAPSLYKHVPDKAALEVELMALALADRFPPGADLDAAWAAFVEAFSPRPARRAPRRPGA